MFYSPLIGIHKRHHYDVQKEGKRKGGYKERCSSMASLKSLMVGTVPIPFDDRICTRIRYYTSESHTLWQQFLYVSLQIVLWRSTFRQNSVPKLFKNLAWRNVLNKVFLCYKLVACLHTEPPGISSKERYPAKTHQAKAHSTAPWQMVTNTQPSDDGAKVFEATPRRQCWTTRTLRIERCFRPALIWSLIVRLAQRVLRVRLNFYTRWARAVQKVAYGAIQVKAAVPVGQGWCCPISFATKVIPKLRLPKWYWLLVKDGQTTKTQNLQVAEGTQCNTQVGRRRSSMEHQSIINHLVMLWRHLVPATRQPWAQVPQTISTKVPYLEHQVSDWTLSQD